MITLTLLYKTGHYEEIAPSSEPYRDGFTLQNDCIILDDIENKGILWQRSYCTTEVEKLDNKDEFPKEYWIVRPKNLQFIEAVFLNKRMIYPKKDMSITIDDYLSKPKPSNVAR